MDMGISIGMSETDSRDRKRRNPFVALFVILAVLAAIVLVSGVLSLVFPESGIPFLWVTFPIGPQPAPIPQ